MHLAYLDPHPVPDTCPEALQILQAVDSLSAAGVRVSLLTPAPVDSAGPAAILGRPLHANVDLVHLADWRRCWWLRAVGFGRSSRPFLWQARHWLRNHPCDALLIRNLKLADNLLADGTWPPLFFETHELFARTYHEEHPQPSIVERRKLALLKARERRVYAGARGLIALTGLLADDIRAAYGTTTEMLVAPDGVDLEAAARALGTASPNPEPVLLYLGSLHPWKGVETAVRAMTGVTGARLRIVGGDHHRIAELKQLCHALGVTDKVELVGPVPPERRFAVIDGADICLLPLSDTSIGARFTSPLKLFEYMAMGKPIVASDLPALRIVLTDWENALLVQPDMPEALARAVTTLLAKPTLGQRLGNAARTKAEMCHGWQARSASIRDFIARHA